MSDTLDLSPGEENFSRYFSFLLGILAYFWGFPDGLVAKKKKKNPAANAGDTGDAGSIPESGRSPGGGNDNPLQDSCLENPTDRGVW